MNGHQKQREQSAQMIEEALFALMEEKSFHEITVSEIVTRADVARKTFYRLYKKKEDVLHCFFQKSAMEYKQSYPPLPRYDVAKIAEDFFCFWYSYKKILLLLHKCGLEELLYNEIRQASVEIVKNRIPDNPEKAGADMAYFALYSTGGFLMLLHYWISNEMNEPPRTYAQKISSVLLKYLRAM